MQEEQRKRGRGGISRELETSISRDGFCLHESGSSTIRTLLGSTFLQSGSPIDIVTSTYRHIAWAWASLPPRVPRLSTSHVHTRLSLARFFRPTVKALISRHARLPCIRQSHPLPPSPHQKSHVRPHRARSPILTCKPTFASSLGSTNHASKLVTTALPYPHPRRDALPRHRQSRHPALATAQEGNGILQARHGTRTSFPIGRGSKEESQRRGHGQENLGQHTRALQAPRRTPERRGNADARGVCGSTRG